MGINNKQLSQGCEIQIKKDFIMSFSIHTNTSANFANMYNKFTQNRLDSSLEKMASGFRINRAADDAAGMAIANQLRSQSEGLLQANKNAADAVGLVKIADGAMDEYQKILVTARDKSLQAASDTNSPEARAALEEDVKQLLQQADDIAKNTAFNGINLLDGTFTNKNFQVGSEAGQTISMTIDNTDIASQGIADGDIDLTTQAGADAAIASLDAAIKSIDGIRSGIGSTQNALESRIRVNSATQVNVKAAESSIRDVDMAEEGQNAQKLSLQMQAGAWASGKALESQQLILSFLR
jgi:flagellin